MSLILAADTSTAINSVALCRDDAILAEAVIDGRRLHSERLLPTVQWLLGEAGVTLDALDLLAISIGPGSFTGLRIGAATWKGLAFANDLPLIGVPTLDAMTHLAAVRPKSYVAILLDARMKEVFYAVYRIESGHREKVISEQVGSIARFADEIEGLSDFDAAEVSFLGDGVAVYRAALLERWPEMAVVSAAQSVPRASAVALEGLALFSAGAPSDAGMVNPVYLRKSQAEVNRDKRLASNKA